MYHVPVASQCTYRSGGGGENGYRDDGIEIFRGGEKIEITWPLVCRWLGYIWRVRRTKVDGTEWREGIGVKGSCGWDTTGTSHNLNT